MAEYIPSLILTVTASALVGNWVAGQSIESSKKEIEKCANSLPEVETESDIKPIECIQFRFPTRLILENGTLIELTTTLPAKKEFELNALGDMSTTSRRIIFALGVSVLGATGWAASDLFVPYLPEIRRIRRQKSI